MLERSQKRPRGAERLDVRFARDLGRRPGAVAAVRARVDAQREPFAFFKVGRAPVDAGRGFGLLELFDEIREQFPGTRGGGGGHAELDRAHAA